MAKSQAVEDSREYVIVEAMTGAYLVGIGYEGKPEYTEDERKACRFTNVDAAIQGCLRVEDAYADLQVWEVPECEPSEPPVRIGIHTYGRD